MLFSVKILLPRYFKVQFFQLNDRKQREIEEAREEIKKIQEQSQEAVQRMRAGRDVKIRECEEIRAQVSL